MSFANFCSNHSLFELVRVREEPVWTKEMIITAKEYFSTHIWAYDMSVGH